MTDHRHTIGYGLSNDTLTRFGWQTISCSDIGVTFDVWVEDD